MNSEPVLKQIAFNFLPMIKSCAFTCLKENIPVTIPRLKVISSLSMQMPWNARPRMKKTATHQLSHKTRQEDMVIDLVNDNHGEAQWKAALPWSDQGEDITEDEDDQDPMEMDEDYEEESREVAVSIHKERSVRAKNLQIPPNGR
ncbi:hypothetical protein M422DRAFT_245235 [Sphaerobolus stellatus SS14]|nr:hypothetical protein M422DRAFT_245235 [Sphaerobolus stellatus SS14]